ncbi:MAG: Gfo/Idh/MocA family protein [Armatimonadota bacterium]
MPIRVGLIGYGGVARSHVDDFEFFHPHKGDRSEHDPTAQIVAGCDIKPDALQRFTERTGVTAVYDDYVEMMDEEDLDLITLCTCADVRVEPVVEAARRGIHVLCEKPMACDVAECDEMIRACEQAGVQLVISHQRRSDPYLWHVKRLIDDGLIGDLWFIRGSGKKDRGGRQLHNIGTHLLDCIGIFAGEAEWVHGHCTVDGRECTAQDAEPGDRGAGLVLGDRVTVHVWYRGGAEAILDFGLQPRRFSWELIGTEGRLAEGEDRRLWHYPHPTWEPAADASQWRQIEMPDEAIPTDSGYVNPADANDVMRRRGVYSRVFMLRELFWRMEVGGQHTSSGKVGARPMEVIQGTFASHLKAARQSLPLKERRSPLRK